MCAALYGALIRQSSNPPNTEVNCTAAENPMLLPCYGYKIPLLLPLPLRLTLLGAQGLTCLPARAELQAPKIKCK